MDKRKMKKIGKYDIQVKRAIDDFWREKKYPPSLRDIMAIVGISSSSVCSYVVRKIEGIRITDTGKIIPSWIDDLIKK